MFQMHCTNNLSSELYKFTPEGIYPNFNMHRDSMEFLYISMAREWTYPQGSKKYPKNLPAIYWYFWPTWVYYIHFQPIRLLLNKQGIHGLLESGFASTLNMVLHVNTMCGFGMEQTYLKLPYACLLLGVASNFWNSSSNDQKLQQLLLLAYVPRTCFSQLA